MTTCYIGLGSNLGDRQNFIKTAIKRIRLLMNTSVTKISSVIETLPEGGPRQGPYLNCVIEIKTALFPYELLKRLQKIEADLGRARTIKNGPRVIDLDILRYGDVRINEDALCIPHSKMLKREFVMTPLKEIAPEAVKGLKVATAIRRRKRDRSRR
ncbi:MAG: 2-amino-4-hydroxy-6-hydroxymethyldihydropteridine diphosphokinase [Candidatus Omnitrophota bacterium]